MRPDGWALTLLAMTRNNHFATYIGALVGQIDHVLVVL